jgi:hypothetical protein
MCETIVVNKYKQSYEIYIGRGSDWGNPYSHLQNSKALYTVGTVYEAIESYAKWIITQPQLLRKLRLLKGKVLGCFCKPGPCHGDVLAVMADEYEFWEEYADKHFGKAS